MGIDLEKVKSELEGMRCQEHGRTPQIVRNGEQLTITSCCDPFAKAVNARYGELIRQQGLDGLKNIFGR